MGAKTRHDPGDYAVTGRQAHLRRARQDEAAAVAGISRASRSHFLPFLPDLHSPQEDEVFFREQVFRTCEVWVAETNALLVGFCAFRTGWVDHLYLLPGCVGRSLGQSLLNEAKARHGHLQLWVFLHNSRAISFYERNGFTRVRETDGSGNEERLPDALYKWQRPVIHSVCSEF